MTFRQLAFNNVIRNKRIYLGHFFSSTFAVMIFFTYGLLAFHPNLQGELTGVSIVMNTFGKIGFQISQYLTFFFSFFFILYSVSAFLKNRKKEFGLFMLHGMSHQQLHRLVFLENMLIGILSILIGIGLGMIFSKLVLLVSGSLLATQHTLSFYFPLKAIGTTSIAFFVLFLLISLFTSRMVKVNELGELIKSEEKPKPEPKASVWLSLLAIISIGAGYAFVYHIIVAKDYMSGNQLLLLVGAGVVFVVIGTYFLFTQLSVYVMHTLKNRENTFFKRTNLLVISELIYRMKDNAKTFFMVAIISAVAFTAIGTCAAIGTSGLAESESPYAFRYESYKGNTLEESHVEEIKKQLKQSGFSYKLVSPTFKVTENGLTLIKLTDYNAYAKTLGYPPEKLLNENESLVIPRKKVKSKNNTSKIIRLEHGDLKISLPVQKNLLIPELQDKYGEIVVVSDAVYNKVLQVQTEVDRVGALSEYTLYGFIIKNWTETTDVAKKLMTSINADYRNTDFSLSSLSLKWLEMKQQNGLLSITSVLVGIVFFVFATSFLYFRLFTDLERDQKQYQMISKLGLSQKELKQIVTRQMMILFFLPIVVAMIHSGFGFLTLHQLGQTTSQTISVIQSSIIVLVSFMCMQILYFFIIRKIYMKRLYQKIYE
ncbi:FtsX-like permease family protein [Bacillus gaemokensis]|uniref:ABC transporter permease n=1 Tax=Bacillus gaemokensis TaxID=574375 RepID=A0A073K918_9BACI|nr:FtsX-like permease family protein [Bacillus gaemokensis]KEK23055.1 ABC transporter permease [Bacillus gaemokensis]KYG37726.1 ABC transporter permease [Bacillus gaemokensis]